MTHVLRDGMVTTVTDVRKHGLGRTVQRDVRLDGLVPTVTPVNSDSLLRVIALNASRMGDGLDNITNVLLSRFA